MMASESDGLVRVAAMSRSTMHSHLNDFCAAGVEAAHNRRRQREWRESQVDAGMDMSD